MATWPYEDLQSELRTTLNQHLRTLNSLPTITNPARIVTTHVTLAAAARLDDLLGKWTLDSTIKQIDALVALGCKGVVLQISAPILDASVPNFMGYRTYYSGVVAAIRARGLKLLIETPLVFSQGAFGGSFDYSRYTTPLALLTAVHNHVRYCAEAYAPDWLVVMQEPGTGAKQSGMEISMKQWGTFVAQVVAAIDASPVVNRSLVKLAAGVGAWDEVEYIEAFAKLPTLNAIDLHVYPIASTVIDYIERMKSLANIAQAAGKQITISECGFYPQSKAEVALRLPGSSQVFARDCFENFTLERLLFMDVMGAFMRTYNVAFGAWFYSRQLFGNGALPYDATTASYGLARAEGFLNREAVDAMNAEPRVISSAGWRLSRLANESGVSATFNTSRKVIPGLKEYMI